VVTKGTIGQIISRFRPGDRRPVLLLGAGASFRSEVPLADEAVRRIAVACFSDQNGNGWKDPKATPEQVKEFLLKQEWFEKFKDKPLAEVFPAAVDHLLTPRGFRRDFLRHMLQSPVISSGYRHLGNLVQRGLCKTILTTNFDTKIKDALDSFRPAIQSIDEINKAKGDIVALDLFSPCQIIYLHGVVEYYTDRIVDEETTALNDDLVENLRHILKDSPLIVVGYRGAEKSIMQHLLFEGIQKCNEFAQGIWWCTLKNETLHENVINLAKNIKSNLSQVEIDGFDELTQEIDANFSGKPNVDIGLTQYGDFAEPRYIDALTDYSIDDLDKDLLVTTIDMYCAVKKLEMDKNNRDQFLLQRGILRKVSDRIVPSKSGMLLFGKNVERVFPYSKIQIINPASPTSEIIDGNLIEQLARLERYVDLNEINKEILLKKTRTSELSPAFHPRALHELFINMLVHRDYEIKEYSQIQIITDKEISFTTPGGLPLPILNLVKVQDDGSFDPIAGLAEYRNPIIADIFHGIGRMEKSGTGLVGVKEFMLECGGIASYKISQGNSEMISTLKQAEVKVSTGQQVANPIVAAELYTTNLLPLISLPSKIYFIPLREELRGKVDLSFELGKVSNLPIYIVDLWSKENRMISFFDPIDYKEKYDGLFNHELQGSNTLAECANNRILHNKVSWLIGEYWKRHLET
jgi:hypothetical protein